MGLDLTAVRLPARRCGTVVEPVDLSRFAGFQASAAQLPALLADRTPPDRARVLVQFVKDWNYWVDSRGEMLHGDPDDGADRFDLACIATIVHALTARDAHEVPGWVHRYRAQPRRLITGMAVESDFGRLVAASAPAVCDTHGVYFEADMLDRGRPDAHG